MSYVDGFVIPIAKKNIQIYRKMAQLGCKMWLKHGALEYRECVGEDLNIKFGVPFTRNAKAKAGETVIFAYIVFKSRAHRDRVNAKVMKGMGDPNVSKKLPKTMPFDMKRMVYGGFKTLVKA